MKNNDDLKKDVEDALKWEPLLHGSDIRVSINAGVVNLSGVVNNFAKKSIAEQAAQSVAQVIGVVENIDVQFDSANLKSDDEIKEDVISAFKWHWDIPNEKISVNVNDGWILLSGEIDWNYQKEAAKNAIKHLIGVKGIRNNIIVTHKFNDKI